MRKHEASCQDTNCQESHQKDVQCHDSSCDEACVASPYGKIDTQALDVMIQAGVPMTLIDARSAKWDDGTRIANAHSIGSDITQDSVRSLIPTQKSLVVVYCSNTQCIASSRVATKLNEFGYKNILKYEEGIEAWIASGRKVHKG